LSNQLSGRGRLSITIAVAGRDLCPSAQENNNACFIVRDGNGQALNYFYFEEEPGRRSAAKLVTTDKARRQLAQVPDLIQRSDSGAEARQRSLDIAAQDFRSPLKSKTSVP